MQCLRGVRQGCPLSGSIWAPCFDPVVRKMKCYISSHQCQLGAFADDPGMSCAFFQCFPILLRWFGLVRFAAGLAMSSHR
eukprot:8042370-Pyramimonas_sp.AAC.1